VAIVDRARPKAFEVGVEGCPDQHGARNTKVIVLPRRTSVDHPIFLLFNL
jgi:hypothetical protein